MGLALISTRESELYAESLGVNVYRHKLYAFTVSALFSGFIGAFYAHWTGAFTPSNLSFTLLLEILVMVLIGGIGTQFGPVIGAFILTFLSQYLRAYLAGQVALFRLAIIGLLIPVVLILLPSGLTSLVGRLKRPRGTVLKKASTG
jgi:branched-chain amino acid transport system permease protein